MEPEWHQDDKSIQPRQLPQFEVAGPQIDAEVRAKAVKLVVGRSGLVLGIITAAVVIMLIPTAMRGTRTDFAKIQVTEEDPFTGQIGLRLNSLERKREFKGWLFTTKAGEMTEGKPWPFSREGQASSEGRRRRLEFVVCDITLTNNSPEKTFKVNPFAFVLTTTGGISYKTDLAITSYRGRLKHGSLRPGKTRKGCLVFKVPENEGLSSLEIMGAAGPVARLSL